MNILQWKIGDRTFFSLKVDDRLLLLPSKLQKYQDGPNLHLWQPATMNLAKINLNINILQKNSVKCQKIEVKHT